MAVTACSRCGAEVEPNGVSCPTCGEAIDDPASALIGAVVLGFYEIIAILGQGGMSVVYRAKHRLTDQEVALKILPPELAVHAGIRARFLEEAKALARLEHPNIVRLYHFGEESGHFVLAMQLVEGEDFEQRILRLGRIPWREAVDVVRQILLALEYAHGKGIIHRDIKPSNILVRADGTALVMDFGIAKMRHGSSRLTQTGQTMGTVRYMSPEQVRGQSVGAGTDIYSLGVTLWESLTGETPFDGDTHFDIMSKHLSEEPPSMLGKAPELPPELDRAVLRAMQKHPDARHPSARAFREALEAVLAEETKPTAERKAAQSAQPTQAATPHAVAMPAPEGAVRRAPRRGAGRWLALGAAALVAAAGGYVLWRHPWTSSPGAAASEDSAASTAQPGGWPEPTLVPGLTPAVDRQYAPPEQVRVVSERPLDAAHMARAYVAARDRFIDFVGRQQSGRAVTLGPLNLVIAPSMVMCSPALYAPQPVDARCSTRRFRLLAESRTLYVLDDAALEGLNLPEGTAWFLCNTSPALVELGCAGLLNAYFDDVEKAQ